MPVPTPEDFINYKKLLADNPGAVDLSDIPDHLKQKIDLAIEIVDGVTDDWFRIKPMLVNMFSISDRTRFSRRHYSTKKQILNLFDRAVITYWKEKTGVELWIDPSKLHDNSWVRHPAGWGMLQYNKKKFEDAKKLKEQQQQADEEDNRF